MRNSFDLRSETDRSALAAYLPKIDTVVFATDRDTFLMALSCAASALPSNIPLVYQYGAVSVFRTRTDLASIVDLGRYLHRLRHFEGFTEFARGFGNPSQFWDSFFEAKVAAFFAGLPDVSDFVLSPKLSVKGRTKYPEFQFTACEGKTTVECKRLHFDLTKAAETAKAHFDALADAMKKERWPAGFRLEVEFSTALREQVTTVAARIVSVATNLAAGVGASFHECGVEGHVVPLDHGYRLRTDAAGLHEFMMRGEDGASFHLIEPRHTQLHVLHSRLDTKLLRLLRAAIKAARTQLPETAHGIICIGDVPIRFSSEVFDAAASRLVLPAHIRMLCLWDGDEFKIYTPADDDFARRLLGDSAQAM
jgi:hypothetical protein